MRKITTLFALMLLSVSTAMAGKESAETVTGRYNRPGYSLIVVDATSGYSNHLKKWRSSYKPMSKFDYNSIATTVIKPVTPKPSETPTQTSIMPSAAQTNAVNTKAVCRQLSELGVGKQITSFVFNRKANGDMDDSLVKERGSYNATANDELDAAATAMGTKITIEDSGYDLLSKNFVILLQFSEYKKEDEIMSAKGTASLYRIDYSRDFLDNKLFANAWIYPEDSEAVRKQKVSYYNSLDFGFSHVATVQVGLSTVSTKEKTTTEYMQELHNDIYNSAIYKFESTVEEFKVQVPVESVKPIAARIGKKESLKNGRRYDAYYFKVNNQNQTVPVRAAVVRSTTIADNTENKELTSEFLQISGYHIEDGYILKQRNDLRMSISPGVRFGSLSGYGAGLEMLANLKTSGVATYGTLYANYKPYNIYEMNNGKNYLIDSQPELFDDGSWGTSYVCVGAGITYRLLRYIELGANINVGADFLITSWDDDTAQYYTEETIGYAYTFSAGILARVNIFYPLHFFVAADFAAVFSEGDDCADYRTLNSIMSDAGMKERGGISCTIGLTYNF